MSKAYTGQPDRETENDLRVEWLLNKLEQDIAAGNPIQNEQLEELKRLTERDHPRALYLAGCYYDRNANGAELEKTALDFWRRAADLGEKKSLACLGDYYVQAGGSMFWQEAWHWQEAWDCYTAEGAPALTGSRREAIVNILNQGKYNLRILRRCAVFVIIAVLILIAELMFDIFPAGIPFRTVGIIALVIEMVCIIRKVRRTPFASLWQRLIALYSIWFAAMLFCLILP